MKTTIYLLIKYSNRSTITSRAYSDKKYALGLLNKLNTYYNSKSKWLADQKTYVNSDASVIALTKKIRLLEEREETLPTSNYREDIDIRKLYYRQLSDCEEELHDLKAELKLKWESDNPFSSDGNNRNNVFYRLEEIILVTQ